MFKEKLVTLRFIPLILSCAGLISCASLLSCAAQDDDGGRESIFEVITVPAESLKGNLLGAGTEQRAQIYLPPSYDSSEKRYPVIYYLHGYSANSTEIADYSDEIKSFITKSEDNEMIVVSVNANSTYGGAFYSDSAASGNWETFFSQELVDYIDENYRTLAQPESRGLAGFSMGGFGAIYLGLRHPDRFSVVYALSPGMFTNSGLLSAYQSWVSYGDNVLECYGAAFSPNLSNPPYYANVPTESEIAAGGRVVDQWLNGYGNWKEKVDEYLAKDARLTNILVECGAQDEFGWLVAGSAYFCDLLDKNDLKHKYTVFQGRHGNFNGVRIKEYMLPFFKDNLSFE